MRNIFTLLITVLLSATLWAQSPEKMSYQAVIRDASDNLVTNQTVGMQISILQGSADGTAVYSEMQTSTTNANGLVSIEIGTGTSSDDFSAIDWSNGPFFIKTETDPAGENNYTITGTSQLLSVPYALHAKTAENIINDQVDDADADPTNEIDVTSQNGLLVGDGANISGLVGSTEGEVLKWDGSEWSLGTDETATGGTLWTATRDDTYYNAGNVGVGTDTPTNALHIRADSPFPVKIESLTGPDSGIEFANSSGTQGYMGSLGLGSDMAMGTVDGNTTGSLLFLTNNLVRMNLSPAGNLGLGTLGPEAKLHIRSSDPEALRIQSTEDGVTSEYYTSAGRVGYVGSLFSENMDFGTVSDNTTGKVYLRTQGLRRLAIDAEGNIGIGTISPDATLDLLGGQWDVDNTEGDFRIGNSVNRLKIGIATGGGGAGIVRIRAVGTANQLRLGAGANDVIIVEEDGVEIKGELNTTETGSSNMLPLAYGYVTAGGTIGNGSGNWTVTRVGEGDYHIKIAGENFAASTHIAVVSKIGASGGIGWGSSSGNLRVTSVDSSNSISDANFSFVVYKP